MSKGVLVINTFPWTTQVKAQSTIIIKTAAAKNISLGVSKNSVVKGKNKRGVIKAARIKMVFIAVFKSVTKADLFIVLLLASLEGYAAVIVRTSENYL